MPPRLLFRDTTHTQRPAAKNPRRALSVVLVREYLRLSEGWLPRPHFLVRRTMETKQGEGSSEASTCPRDIPLA